MLYSLILSLICSLSSQAAIFGADDRVAITPLTPAYGLARSTAIAVLSSNYSEQKPGKLKLDTNNMSELVCSEERFSKDPIMGWSCTGFLVAPDLIVTAGHCMVNTGESRNETDTYCEAFSWLFDYHRDSSGRILTDDIPSDKLYKCKQTVYAVKEENAPYRDFALVQLDRPVTDREPLKLSTKAASLSDPLTMIGYPFGSPAKLSWNAKVILDNLDRESFLTSLDAFDGNSGSPVFNAQNEVAGILIAGTPSNAIVKTNKSCSVYNRCRDDGTGCALPDQNTDFFRGYQGVGSEVQRIAPVIKLIEDFQRL